MRRMIWSGVAASALVASLAGCSQRQESSSSDAFEAAETQTREEPPSPPGIAPTAAPGVAFNYRYGFSLPDVNISTAQEAHAAACEKLGLSRCRITGMTYELDDRDRVHALTIKATAPGES